MGSKFKMPPHPAFENGFDQMTKFMLGMSENDRYKMIQDQIEKNSQEFSSVEDLVTALSTSPTNDYSKENMLKVIQRAKITFFTESAMRASLYDNGCNLFKIESSHWDEDKSRKTIEKLNVEDFKLPFDTCAIDISGADWAGIYTLALVSFYRKEENDGQLVIRLENKNQDWFCFFIPLIGTFKYGMSLVALDDIQRGTAYKVLSIMMYAATFKRDTNRFIERKVKARRSQKLPSYRINEVRLIQPEYSITGKKGRNGSSHLQFYIVKGHWRSQPYGKREEGKTRPTWINRFWKGEGREIVAKTYKI